MHKRIDPLTAIGRRWMYPRDHVVGLILKAHPAWSASVPDSQEGVYDCIFTRGEEMVMLAEIRSRGYCTGDIPLTERMVMRGGYVVNWDKLESLGNRSQEFGIPSSLIVDLPIEGKVMMIKLTDDTGEYRPPIHLHIDKRNDRILAQVYPTPDHIRVYPYSSPGMISVPIS